MTTTLPRATAGDGHNFMPNCGSREGTDSCWLCSSPAARHPAPNPDPLRPPETDEEPWTIPDDDEDSGLWAGVAFVLTVALVALVIGFVIGRATA